MSFDLRDRWVLTDEAVGVKGGLGNILLRVFLSLPDGADHPVRWHEVPCCIGVLTFSVAMVVLTDADDVSPIVEAGIIDLGRDEVVPYLCRLRATSEPVYDLADRVAPEQDFHEPLPARTVAVLIKRELALVGV